MSPIGDKLLTVKRPASRNGGGPFPFGWNHFQQGWLIGWTAFLNIPQTPHFNSFILSQSCQIRSQGEKFFWKKTAKVEKY
jgi:hypothetical protein